VVTKLNKSRKTVQSLRAKEFHGLNQELPIAAMTKNQWWEKDIALGHTPATLGPYLSEGQVPFLSKWQSILVATHPLLISAVNEPLHEMVQGLGWDTPSCQL
jgi:hypothetical protein